MTKAKGSPVIRESPDQQIAKTGEPCKVPGLYESDCRHRERKLIRQGAAFPCCMAGRHVVSWHLVRSIR